MKKSNLLLSLILLMIGTLAATAPVPASAGTPTQPTEEIYLGLGEATPGENGWIISDYIIHVISPADTLVNGSPIQNGRFTITPMDDTPSSSSPALSDRKIPSLSLSISTKPRRPSNGPPSKTWLCLAGLT